MAFDAQPILLGNGYGGFVALLLAIRHPGWPRLGARRLRRCFRAGPRCVTWNVRGGAKGGLAAIADVAMQRLFAPEYQAAHPDLIAQRKARFLALDPRRFMPPAQRSPDSTCASS